jgi:nucleoside-diphosphate-sugar epimerase
VGAIGIEGAVLVTGASGFIASHLVDALLAEGHEVRGVDLRTPDDDVIASGNLAGAGGLTLTPADLAEDALESIVDGCDVVFHLAGTPGVRDCWGERFGRYIRGNITATSRLLSACEATGVRRFIIASSSSVYGPVGAASQESDVTRPVSPYGVSKLAAEQLALAYGSRRDTALGVVALRLFTVYGPRQRGDMAIGRLLLAALTGETVPLHGDGTQRREFSYVGDVVAAFRAAAALDAPATVVNVGGGVSVAMSEVIALVEKLTGRRLHLAREGVKPGEVQDTVADLTLARDLLGYRPAVTLEQGMAAQLAWLEQLDDRYVHELLVQLKA